MMQLERQAHEDLVVGTLCLVGVLGFSQFNVYLSPFCVTCFVRVQGYKNEGDVGSEPRAENLGVQKTILDSVQDALKWGEQRKEEGSETGGVAQVRVWGSRAKWIVGSGGEMGQNRDWM